MPEQNESLLDQLIMIEDAVPQAMELSAPKNIPVLLQASVEVRTLILETAAQLAIFSASSISNALGQHTRLISDEDGEKYLMSAERTHKDLTSGDGKIISLIGNDIDAFRYSVARKIDYSFGQHLHESAYRACIKKSTALRLCEVEEKSLLSMLRHSHYLAETAATTISIPGLRKLSAVQDVLNRKYAPEEIFRVRQKFDTENMGDAWDLSATLLHT